MIKKFAEIDNKNFVLRVINAESKEWCEIYLSGRWVETFNNGVIPAQYATDIATLRANKVAFPGLRGVAFRVATNNNYYAGFRALTRATFVNDGVYTPPSNISNLTGDFGNNLDVIPGGESGANPNYYLQLIRTALNNLGFNIAPCPPPTP